MALDLNTLDVNSIQDYLPTSMTKDSFYGQFGVGADYDTWLKNNIQTSLNQTNYSTFDPRTFAPGHNDSMRGDPTGLTQAGANRDALTAPDPNRLTQSQIQAQGNAYAKDQGFGSTNNVNSSSATPGAIDALKKGGPDLKNRRPSLAAGWGGWDAGSENGPAGNANFTYFSRFA